MGAPPQFSDIPEVSKFSTMYIAKMTLFLGLAGCVSASSEDFEVGEKVVFSPNYSIGNYVIQKSNSPSGWITVRIHYPQNGKIIGMIQSRRGTDLYEVQFEGDNATTKPCFISAEKLKLYRRRLAANPLIERFIRES